MRLFVIISNFEMERQTRPPHQTQQKNEEIIQVIYYIRSQKSPWYLHNQFSQVATQHMLLPYKLAATRTPTQTLKLTFQQP